MLSRRRLRIAALAGALALPLPACNSDRTSAVVGSFDGGSDGDAGKVYPLTFICGSDAGADCPSGQPCPEVPLSSAACGDIPMNLGHEAILETTGHPVGCMARLPYGNPYYLDTQVQCVCLANWIASSTAAGWACAL